VFEGLKNHPVILVTGPQRSGTRFITKAICYDTGHTYVDEAEIHTDSLYALDILIDTRTTPVAVQCPALCSVLPGYISRCEECFLVMCFRNTPMIEKSAMRIDWRWDSLEASRYATRTDVLPQDMLETWPSHRLKYAVWMQDKQIISGRFLELRYETLEDHPLWVPPERRNGWGFSQTEEIKTKETQEESQKEVIPCS
jgi:hypothetical protein